MSQGLVTVETDPVAFWQVLPCSPKTNGWPKSHIDWENNDLFMGPCVTLSTWGPSKSNPTKWSSCLAQWDTHKLVLKRWYTTNEQTLFPKKTFQTGDIRHTLSSIGWFGEIKNSLCFLRGPLCLCLCLCFASWLVDLLPWFLGVEPFFGKSVALTHGEKNYKIHYENVCPQ